MNLPAELEWSDWFELEELASVPNPFALGPGVYRFRFTDSVGRARPCPRLLATDESGIVYIGRSKGNLRSRVLQVIKGRKTGKELTHTLGRKLFILDRFSSFRATYDGLRLECQAAPAADAVATEDYLIRAYQAQYGEVPPLNGEFKGRGDLESWREFVDQ